MQSVGAFEARKKLSQLLDWVQRGQVFTIIRHGKEVARLVPAPSIHSKEVAHAAVRRIRERAEQHKFGRFDWSEWRSYRDRRRS